MVVSCAQRQLAVHRLGGAIHSQYSLQETDRVTPAHVHAAACIVGGGPSEPATGWMRRRPHLKADAPYKTPSHTNARALTGCSSATQTSRRAATARVPGSLAKAAAICPRSKSSAAPRQPPSTQPSTSARRATCAAYRGRRWWLWLMSACAARESESARRLEASHTWKHMACAAASTVPILQACRATRPLPCRVNCHRCMTLHKACTVRESCAQWVIYGWLERCIVLVEH